MQGSTGAGGAEVMEHVGVPTLAAITQAIEALRGGRRPRHDADRADGRHPRRHRRGQGAPASAPTRWRWAPRSSSPAAASPAMQCHVGQCVTGIATQDPEHERRYNPVAEARNIHRYLEGVRWQIAALTQALGYANTSALRRGRPGGAHPRRGRDDGPRLRAGISRARAGTAQQDGLSHGDHEGDGGGRASARRAAGRYRRRPLRAGALPDRLSGGHRLALLYRLHLGTAVRGGVRGDHGDEPVQLDLRAGVRRTVRAGLPAHRFRRARPDPQSQALRHG